MLHAATTEVARSEEWAIGYHSEIVLENPTHQLSVRVCFCSTGAANASRTDAVQRCTHFLFDDLERFSLHITSMTFHMDAVRRLCAQPRHLGFSTRQPAGPMGGGDQEVTGLQRWSTHQPFQVVRNNDMEHFLLWVMFPAAVSAFSVNLMEQQIFCTYFSTKSQPWRFTGSTLKVLSIPTISQLKKYTMNLGP